jgi:hypothetical protein
MRALVGLRLLEKRSLFGFERLQQLHHARELAFVEARSGVADIDQFAWGPTPTR